VRRAPTKLAPPEKPAPKKRAKRKPPGPRSPTGRHHKRYRERALANDGKTPRRDGHPSLCTPVQLDSVCKAIRAGNPLEVSAVYGGLAKITVFAWMRRGKRALHDAEESGQPIAVLERPYVAFAQAVEQARADCEVGLVGYLTRAAMDDKVSTRGPAVRAAMFLLEHCFSKRWGNQQIRVAVGGDASSPPIRAEVDVGETQTVIVRYPEPGRVGCADGACVPGETHGGVVFCGVCGIPIEPPKEPRT
jgi:hypothetical protein